MWNYHYLARIDFRIIPVILGLMAISLLVVSAYAVDASPEAITEEAFFTPVVKRQAQWFILGWGVFLFLRLLTTTSCGNGPGYYMD